MALKILDEATLLPVEQSATARSGLRVLDEVTMQPLGAPAAVPVAPPQALAQLEPSKPLLSSERLQPAIDKLRGWLTNTAWWAPSTVGTPKMPWEGMEEIAGQIIPGSAKLGRINDAGEPVDEQGNPLKTPASKSLYEWMHDPNTSVDRHGVIGRGSQLFEQLVKTAPLIAEWAAYSVPKTFIEPILQFNKEIWTENEEWASLTPAQKYKLAWERSNEKLQEGIYEQLRGLQQFMLAPFGYYVPEDDPNGWVFSIEGFKKNWDTQPIATALALLPWIKAAVEVKADLRAGRTPKKIDSTKIASEGGGPPELMSEQNAIIALAESKKAREAVGGTPVDVDFDLAKSYEEAAKPFGEKVKRARKKKQKEEAASAVVVEEPVVAEKPPTIRERQAAARKAAQGVGEPATVGSLQERQAQARRAAQGLPEPEVLTELEAAYREPQLSPAARREAAIKRAQQAPDEALLRGKTTQEQLVEPLATIVEPEPTRLVERQLPPKVRKKYKQLREKVVAEKQAARVEERKPAATEEPTPEQLAKAAEFEKELPELTDAEIAEVAREMAVDEMIPEPAAPTPAPTPKKPKKSKAARIRSEAELRAPLTKEEIAEPLPTEFGAEEQAVAAPVQPSFDTDVATTTKRAEQYKRRPKLAESSPEAAFMKQLNDVNRWRHGEQVDIAQARATIDEFASSVDKLGHWFESKKSFLEFRDTVQRAAKWASTVERAGGGGGVQLNALVPIEQLIDLVKKGSRYRASLVQAIDDVKRLRPEAQYVRVLVDTNKPSTEAYFTLGQRFAGIAERLPIDQPIIVVGGAGPEMSRTAATFVVSHELGHYSDPGLLAQSERQARARFQETKAQILNATVGARTREQQAAIDTAYRAIPSERVADTYARTLIDDLVQQGVKLEPIREGELDYLQLYSGVDPARIADLVKRIRGLGAIPDLERRNRSLLELSKELTRDEADALMRERESVSARSKELMSSKDYDAAMIEATVGQHLREVVEESGKLLSQDARRGYADSVGGNFVKFEALQRKIEDREWGEELRSWETPVLFDRPASKFAKGDIADYNGKRVEVIARSGFRMYDIRLPTNEELLGIDQGQLRRYVKPSSVKLRSGIDVDELAKLPAAAFEAARRAKVLPPIGDRVKKAARTVNRAVFDVSGNIKTDLVEHFKDAGYYVVQKLTNTLGASAEARRQLDVLDRQVFRGKSQAQLDLLDEVMFSRRVLQIDEIHGLGTINHPGGTGVNYAAHLLKLRERLGEKAFADLWQDATTLFNAGRASLKRLRDARLISEETYQALQKFDYQRREMVDKIDPAYEVTVGRRTGSVHESGIEDIARGAKGENLETNARFLISELIVRAENRIAWNEANMSLAELATKYPDNPFVRLPKKEAAKIGGTEGIPEGFQRIKYWKDGKRATIGLAPEWAQEWVSRNTAASWELSQVMRWASGSPLVRLFATGINPGFALRNPFRDIARMITVSQHYVDGKWTSTYSKHYPIATAQVARDLAAVSWDVLTNGPRVQKYMEGYGGMEWMSSQGSPVRQTLISGHMKNTLGRVVDIMAWAGTKSEMWSRLALRERALRKGLPETEANFLARDVLDYNQAGYITRAANQGLVFFNANVQAMRGYLRAGYRNPKEMGYKMAQLVGFSAMVHIANRIMNPEMIDNVSAEDRKSNWIFGPQGIKIADAKGQDRLGFFKVPVSQEMKFWKYLGENIGDKLLGNKIDVDGVVKELKSLSPLPTNVGQYMFPTLESIASYVSDYKFWTDDTIWHGPEIKGEASGERILGKTPIPAQWIGDVSKQISGATGVNVQLSPERLTYAAQRLIPGSMYGQMMGSAMNSVLADLPEQDRDMLWAEAFATNGLSNGFFGLTHPLNKWGDRMEKIDSEETAIQHYNSSRLKAWADKMFEGKVTIDDVTKNAIASVKGEREQTRLLDRLEFAIETHDMKNYSFWMRMHAIDTAEARARVFHDRISEASEKERAVLQGEMGRVSSLFSDAFWDAYGHLVNEKR